MKMNQNSFGRRLCLNPMEELKALAAPPLLVGLKRRKGRGQRGERTQMEITPQ